MLGALLKDGVEITNDAAQADAIIVNTCSFIDAAQEESVDAILESAEVRAAQNRGQSLIVSGCLPQRFRDELPKLLPEVDAFMGIDQVAQVSDIVRQAMAQPRGANWETSNIQRPTSNIEGKNHRAFGRIGKTRAARSTKNPNHFAEPKNLAKQKPSWRALPILNRRPPTPPILDVTRVPLSSPISPRRVSASRPSISPTSRLPRAAIIRAASASSPGCAVRIAAAQQSDIVAEAKALIADGVKELNLISQDSTYYGLDLRPNHSRAISSPEKFSAAAGSLPADATTICTLLRELNSLQGDFWIRLLYTHPAHWTDELIRTIAECPKVARYVDIPLQHIHENMLERMRRETSQQYIVDLIRKIRAGVPGIALRTTFIVGFPAKPRRALKRCSISSGKPGSSGGRVRVFAGGRHAGRHNGRTNSRQGETAAPRTGDGRATQNRPASFGILCGRKIKVLVEGKANEKQLEGQCQFVGTRSPARRQPNNRESKIRIYLVAAAKRTRRTLTAGFTSRKLVATVSAGEFARVKIVGHTDYDLIAEPV